MLDFVIFAVTFLTVLLVAIAWLYPSSKKVTTIPGLDPTSKEDGNLSDISRAGSLHEFLVDAHGQFGPITGFWWGQKYVVSIASPQLFQDHAQVFDRPAELFQLYEPLLGSQSLFFANGGNGRMRRKNYDNLFQQNSAQDYLANLTLKAKEVEAIWTDAGKDDHVPLSEHALRFSVKAVLAWLLGLEDDIKVAQFQSSFDKVWSEMDKRLYEPVLPDEGSPREKNFKTALKNLHDILGRVIAERKKLQTGKQDGLLVDTLIGAAADEETQISDAMTFLFSGIHTTASLLTWCFYFLATHQEVQTELRKEIDRALGQGESLDANAFAKMKYMRQVLEETLRCTVITTWGARVQDFDSELGGHRIPKKTPVIQAYGVVLQDATLWPLPREFDPDRFSDEKEKVVSPFDFAPFGFAGKRKCPGSKWAYMAAATFASVLLHKFEVSLCSDQTVQPVYGLVTHPEEEIWVKVTKRK